LATPATYEKRAAPRYRLSLPVLVRWSEGETHLCGGFTRDVSTRGAFVLCSEKLPLDTTVEIEILLPTSGKLPGMTVRTTGRVVRTYVENEGAGFAVEGQFGQSEFPDMAARPARQ
jgi:PilZ domain